MPYSNVYFSFGYVRCPVVEYDAFLKFTFFLSSDTGKVMIYRARNYKKVRAALMALFFEYPEQVIYIRKGKTLASQEAAEE